MKNKGEQREVKYKVYIPKTKEMHFVELWEEYEIGRGYVIVNGMPWYIRYSAHGKEIKFLDTSESWVLLRYTGLKDKNGIEIYEGDILRQQKKFVLNGEEYLNGSEIKIVKWNDNTNGWNVKDMSKFEIIGTIYGNNKK